MTRWHVIPVLGTIMLGGAAPAYCAPDAIDKPGAQTAAPGYGAQAPSSLAPGTINRVPSQDYVAPTPSPVYGAPPVVRPSPNDPYAGVTLPTQRGDAAYQGGGVVLEQDENGVNRRVR